MTDTGGEKDPHVILLDLSDNDGLRSLRLILKRHPERLLIAMDLETCTTVHVGLHEPDLQAILVAAKVSKKRVQHESTERHEKTRGSNPWCNARSPKKKSWER